MSWTNGFGLNTSIYLRESKNSAKKFQKANAVGIRHFYLKNYNFFGQQPFNQAIYYFYFYFLKKGFSFTIQRSVIILSKF